MPDIMDKKIVRRFEEIVGPENLDMSPEGAVTHAYDATRLHHRPDIILYPRNTRDVSQILALCNRHEIPVCPRGAGSGFAGGSVPIRGGVALVMTRMNEIREIQTEDLLAVVQPGVVNGAFQGRAEELGLFYPPDPGSMAFSTLGGNVATGAGGLRSLKYGVTRDYVLGLEAVLADGRIIKTGVRTLKSVVGYDLTRLLIGSEGTLAVITEMTLKLIPKPEMQRAALVTFRTPADAGRAVSRIIASRIIPSTLEFMDSACMQAVEEHLHLGLAAPDHAYLLIEVDGSPEESEQEIRKIETLCRACGARKIEVAPDRKDRERLWQARRTISQAINRMGLQKVNEDIAVPRSRIPEILAFLSRLAETSNLKILTFGHAGDGNLHVNILVEPENLPKAHDAVKQLFKEVLRLDGTLSAEHGIGLAKSPYLAMEVAPESLELMRQIKKTFDPKGILNPGKIFAETP
jgi:glycolate oxidase